MIYEIMAAAAAGKPERGRVNEDGIQTDGTLQADAFRAGAVRGGRRFFRGAWRIEQAGSRLNSLESEVKLVVNALGIDTVSRLTDGGEE